MSNTIQKPAYKPNKLGEKEIPPLLLSMAWPPIISMLIQALYNIVDSIFVAQLGQEALTALSLVFPLQNIMLAIALGTGIGLNSCIARHLGAGNLDKANQTATQALLLSLGHCLLIAAAGALFVGPFLRFFSSDALVLQWSYDYAYIVVLFSFGMVFQLTIENMFIATGKMLIPMLLQGTGAIINIALDPILIFGLFGFPALGVKGAAIATVVGQITACLLAVILLRSKHKELKPFSRGFRPSKQISGEIYQIALPSMLMLSLPSVMVGLLNGILMALSQTAVALFGIYYRLQTFVYMPCFGIMQALRPIVGYNYGARDKSRVYAAMRLALLMAALIMFIGSIVLLTMPKSILLLFKASEDMLSMGISALRIISLGLILSAGSIILTAVFESLGKGVHSLIISLFRQVLLLPPLALLLSSRVGLLGVWIAFPITELLALLVSIALFVSVKRRDAVLGSPLQDRN